MSDEAWQFADLEAAYAAGIGAAMHIRADEIFNGATVAQMDVRIESTGGEQLARGIVSLPTSRLIEW